MAIGIDEIEEYDDFEEPIQQEEPEVEEKEWMEPSSNQYSDIINDVLTSKGINPSAIKFEDEQGNIQERDWNSLTREEQFNILNTPEAGPQLSDEETKLLESIRQQGLSIEEYENLLRQQGAQYATQQYEQQEPVYQVDDISDDDLFVYDLRSKVEMTDEQAQRALEKAKEDPDIYVKQVEAIRNQYRDLEQQDAQERQAIAQQQYQDQFNQFADSINYQIDNMGGIGGLDIQLSPEDKEELSEFILGRGADGVSNLGRAVNDPETLVKMSWFALNGVDAFDGIVDYFKSEISKVREESYRKGYNDARNGAPQVVVKQKPQQPKYQEEAQRTDINDLD